MKVMVVGSGGREHALVRYLLRSPSVTAVACYPGHDAMAASGARCFPGRVDDASGLLRAAREAGSDLVVIGPEAPLVHGVADILRREGLAVFGPGSDGARIEGSKAWAKDFMQRHHIPTARAQVFTDFDSAAAYIKSQSVPPVIKVDGLAAGKGVTVAGSHDEALAAAHRSLVEGAFGTAGQRIVVEERLTGPEVSVLAVLDGTSYLVLPPVQDHKAVFDGGRGPNTGGMGAYSPVPLAEAMLADIERQIIGPAVRGLQREGIEYRGILYAGLMLTPQGPRVLEFNCRFGDPETQALLPRVTGDLGELLAAAANGKLPSSPPAIAASATVCVVMASAGYPGEYAVGKVIHGLDRAASLPGVNIDHAGTRRSGNLWLTAGGRVLSVTAMASSLRAARELAYRACSLINFEGHHYRRDIAADPPRPKT